MKVSISNSKNLLRTAAYAVQILICSYWIFDNYAGANYFNWTMFCLLGINISGLLLKRQIVDKLLGFVMMIGSLYMLAAVLSAYGKSDAAGHHSAAVAMLIFGGVVFLLSFILGNALLFLAIFSEGTNRARILSS